MAISSSAFPPEAAATTETSILEPTRFRWASDAPTLKGRREEKTDRRPVKRREEDRSMRGRDAGAVGDTERDAEAKTMAIGDYIM